MQRITVIIIRSEKKTQVTKQHSTYAAIKFQVAVRAERASQKYVLERVLNNLLNIISIFHLYLLNQR